MISYWNKTITVFNKYEDTITGLVTWYRHIIENCFYKKTNIAVTVGNTRIQTDENVVRINLQPNYKTPSEWLISNNRSDYVTLQTGDIIIYGEVNDEINEMIRGQRSTDIIAKYKSMGVMTIKSVNENVDLPNKHYLVRGE